MAHNRNMDEMRHRHKVEFIASLNPNRQVTSSDGEGCGWIKLDHDATQHHIVASLIAYFRGKTVKVTIEEAEP